jgi:uncharacterized protein
MRTRTVALALASLLFLPAAGTAQTPNAQLGSAMEAKKVDPAKEQSIRKLFEVTRSANMLLDGMKAGLESQKKAQATIPAIFWEELIKRAETDVGEFLTTLVGIYDQHYTKEQIDEMLAFYETPLGRMMADKASVVGLATMGAAERWGMKLGMQVMMELVEKGAITP